jgi:pimeloyl-ACP methyl ester carboxylesterase
MKNKQILLISLWLLLITVFISCEKSSDESKISGKYLYDYTLVASYSEAEIKSVLSFAGLDTLLQYTNYGGKVYKVIYQTTFLGEQILASGLFAVPDVSGDFPILSFQNGTNTCHRNAPSVNPNDLFFTLISSAAGSGYIIAITDYIGFGESSDILHPYHHKESSNAAVIDLIRAVKEFVDAPSTNVNSNNQLYLMGYSQGGWASMMALQALETNPLNGIEVKGAACGSGAYNMMDISAHILSLEQYGNPFYLPYYVQSRRQNGLCGSPLSKYFKSPYSESIPELFDGSLCNAELNQQLTNDMSELIQTDLIENFSTSDAYINLRTHLTNSTIVAWNTNAAVRLYYSNGDNSVPGELSENFYNDLLTFGNTDNKYSLVEVDDLDHNEAIVPWGTDALLWIHTLAGK